MSVKIYLDSVVYKSGKNPIVINVSNKGKALRLSTGLSCIKENFKSSKATSKEEHYKAINIKLKNMRLFLENELIENGNTPDWKEYLSLEFKKKFRGYKEPEPEQEKSFFEWFDEWINNSSMAETTIQTYQQTKAILEKFQNETGFQVNFETVGTHFRDEFTKWALEGYNDKESKRRRKNTIEKWFAKLKTFLSWIRDKGIIKVNADYKKIKVIRGQKDNKWEEVKYLNKEQLKKLHDLNLDDHKEEILNLFRGSRYKGNKYAEDSFKRVKRVKDLFLFMCYTSLRYSDLIKLERKHLYFEEEQIKTKSEKTGSKLVIPFFDDYYIKPVEIAKRYLKMDQERVFEYISNVEFNRDLKTIQKYLDIDFPLCTKVGRKTFVTYMLTARKISRTNVMQSTGHKTEASFNRYAGIDPEESIKEHKQKAEFLSKTA